jgi:hypothetical protein
MLLMNLVIRFWDSLSNFLQKIFEECLRLLREIYHVIPTFGIPRWFVTLLPFLSSACLLLLWLFDLEKQGKIVHLLIRLVVLHYLMWHFVPPMSQLKGRRFWMPGMSNPKRKESADILGIESLPNGTILYRKTNLVNDFHAGILLRNIPHLLRQTNMENC